MSSKGWQRLKFALSLVGAIAFVAAFYEYGLAHNRSVVPRWAAEIVNYAWALIIIIGIFVLAPLDERRRVGDLPRGRFTLGPRERSLFKGKFMSGVLYKSAEKFNPRPTLRQWLSEGGIYVRGLLKVNLTTQRLIFGRVAGPTYRVFPLTDIERWSEIEGKWPHRHEVYIEYRYAGRNEGILVWTKSTDGQRFKEALARIIPLGGASRKGAAT